MSRLDDVCYKFVIITESEYKKTFKKILDLDFLN